MKKTLYIFGLAAMFLLASCAQEEINHPSEDQVPSAKAISAPVVTVDQTTNQVTFSLPEGTTAMMPVWIFPDKNGDYNTYSTRNGLTKVYSSAGEYSYRMKLMNAAGVSDDYYEGTFTIDNTLVDFSKYVTFLSGGSSKEWRVKGEVAGHMGCGESGSDGLNWWSAGEWDKLAYGVYEDRMTFTSDYGYTYDPGDDGMTYVNYGVTASPYETGHSEDYNFAVSATTTTYSFEVDGDDLYLKLGAAAFFYIPNDGWVAEPKFKVLSANTKTLELVCDDGSIAWHYILSSEESGDMPFTGFKYNAESNLWLPADAAGAHTIEQYYAITSSWTQQENPEVTDNGDGVYSFTYPLATEQTWQAQFKLFPVTPIAVYSSMTYDFSVKITSSTDVPAATVKICDRTDDGLILLNEQATVTLTALEEKVFYATDIPGNDISDIKLVFDFGGCGDNTEITISNIVLKDHSVDDGTTVPDTDEPDEPDEPDTDVTWVDYDSSDNLWLPADAAHTYFTYLSPGFTGELTFPDIAQDGGKYSFTIAEATYGQWQAQLHIIPDAAIALSSGKTYDFKVSLTASNDIAAVTLKPVDASSDGNYLFTEQVALSAEEEYVFKATGLTGIDCDAMKIVFDFGGNPENTEITINEIILQEHVTPKEAPSYDSDENLWKGVDAEGAHEFSQYYAPGWSPLDNPEITEDGGTYSFSLPTATTDQWQCQFFIIPTSGHEVNISTANTYGFKVTINSSNDIAKATVKLTDTGSDSNYLFTENVALTAYEDCVLSLSGLGAAAEGSTSGFLSDASVKLVFDFGGNPDNTDITISGITLWQE